MIHIFVNTYVNWYVILQTTSLIKKGLWNIFTNYVDIIVNKRRRIVCFITMIGVKIMDDKKAQEQFKRGIKYNRIGFFIILLAIVPMALLEGLVKYI